MKISLIIPCYNEEQALYPLYEALQAAMQQLQDYLLMMVPRMGRWMS